LTSDNEKLVYLDLLRNYAGLHQLSLIGYCLWNHSSWRAYLGQGSDADTAAIRRSTHTGKPLGTPEFIEALEKGDAS